MRVWRECKAQHPERPELRCFRDAGHSQWHQVRCEDMEPEQTMWGNAVTPHWAPHWREEQQQKDEANAGAEYGVRGLS